MSQHHVTEVAGNLPEEATSFVGRRAELDRLQQLLSGAPAPSARRAGGAGDAGRAGSRLVTLVGVGGVGKTRLALRAASRSHPAHPDGVWLVELSPLRDPATVGLAVVEALGLADRTTRPVAEVLAESLRDKRALLILDSCEHVRSGCAELATILLAAAPGARLLATSRQPLGIPAEQCVEVSPLPLSGRTEGSGTAPDSQSCPSDATALFTARATHVDPRFTLDDASHPTVAAICSRLDGIPLAIELAAARLSELSVDELYTALGDRVPSPLDLLAACEGRRNPRPRRHQTLRTAIGWSHELCAPLERLLWARLSVFAGSFTAEGAARVCVGGPLAPERFTELLDGLLDKSVVVRHRTDPARLRMLDTVREFGLDWLRELGEEHALRLRHRDFYRGFAREACATWNTGEQIRWSERTIAEHTNLQAAMDHALAGPDRAVALEMAGSIGFLWRYTSYLREAQHCLDLVLTADPEPGPACFQAAWTRAAVATLQGDLDAVRRWGAVCERLAEDQDLRDDPRIVLAATYPDMAHKVLTRRYDEVDLSLSLVPRPDPGPDWLGAADLQHRTAVAYAWLGRGDYDRAERVFVDLCEASRRCGEGWCRSVAECFLVRIALLRGEPDEAVRLARDAVAGHAAMRSTIPAALSLDALAAAVRATGDGHQAARILAVGQHAWDFAGPAQRGFREFTAAHRRCAEQVREQIGDEDYERAYAEALALPYAEGVEYAVNGAPSA
ncbi:ATP-binding protein [Streptomyces sp. NPDC059009]|uniref:ATP-binding protein n=1 Tax=Streptomyces sp. NPDC059009 TaxID=3346694 RepID=UPI0036A81862